MGRTKILGLFALLGFIAGVAANFAYHKVFPILLQIVPEILRAEWVLSGLAGSLLTIIMIVLWAYLSKPSKYDKNSLTCKNSSVCMEG